MEDLKLAVASLKAVPGEIEKNLDRMHSFALEASAQDAQWICFPELSVTGYSFNKPSDLYGGLTQRNILSRLVQMANESKLILIAGFLEWSTGIKPFISQVVVGSEGIVGTYRKTHLSPQEKRHFQPGSEINVHTCGRTTFGIELCYEAHFPEISTSLALMGADILFIPHASPRGKPEEKLASWMRHLPARAFDNGVFVVACNQVGTYTGGLSFPGVVVIVGPDGKIIDTYTGDSESLLYAHLEAEQLQKTRTHRMKYFIPQRRPELYGPITGMDSKRTP